MKTLVRIKWLKGHVQGQAQWQDGSGVIPGAGIRTFCCGKVCKRRRGGSHRGPWPARGRHVRPGQEGRARPPPRLRNSSGSSASCVFHCAGDSDPRKVSLFQSTGTLLRLTYTHFTFIPSFILISVRQGDWPPDSSETVGVFPGRRTFCSKTEKVPGPTWSPT